MPEIDEAMTGEKSPPGSGSPSNSPFDFAISNTNNKQNPPMLHGPYLEMSRDNPAAQSPFRFARPQIRQPQTARPEDHIHFPQNLPLSPPQVADAAAGIGGAPINPFNFQPPPLRKFDPGAERVTNVYSQYLPLCKAISSGDLQAVKSFLTVRPDAIAVWISKFETPLMSACACGQLAIVKELLRRMTPEQMLIPRYQDGRQLYHTPLTVTAINGNVEIAMDLVAKNPKLIEIPGQDNLLPIVRAVANAHEDMARFLYDRTPLEVLLHLDDGYHGIMLLLNAIFYEMLDIALDLFEVCPSLAITRHPKVGPLPVTCLASRPDLFQSGCNLGFWRSLIYSLAEVKSQTDPETSSSNQNRSVLWMILQLLPRWFGINQIYELKEKHVKANRLLRGICEKVANMDEQERRKNDFEEAFFCAVKFGNKEFLVELIKSNPEFLWLAQNTTNSTIFLLAVEFRQEQIFNLFYGLDDRRNMLIADVSNLGNGVLHIAGLASPPNKLSRVAGAALQLQRELQWFKEVESLVPEIDKENPNSANLKPLEIFESSHEPLKKGAEDWMKNTATSCSVVAALIVTVTFAAIFTIPGGELNDTGDPRHLKETRFVVFIVSDLISFFASCTSVLIFLAILSARYSFDDFLISLPTKMIAGLSILFISIAAMLVAFSTALFTTLYRTSWLVAPVILMAHLPAVLFLLLQYPLLKEMIVNTYGKGIFDRKMKRWL